MEIVTASRFHRLADISVVGVGAGALNHIRHDIYIYIETLNMPEKIKSGKWDPPDRLPGTVSNKDVVISRKGSPYVEISRRMPTYVVHVYRDTGKRITRNGQQSPVLVPQTSFGYFVKHEGDLEGWRHELTSPYANGEDGRLEQISKNFYKITVPNDSIAIVATEIEALEPKLFALSLHAGINLPYGNTKNGYDPGFAGTIDFSYRLRRSLYLELLLGLYQFRGKNQIPDLKVTQVSGNLKYIFPVKGIINLFLHGGSGAYRFESDSTKSGYNVGGGIQFDFSRSVALEAAYNYHRVLDTNPAFQFSALQAVIRYRF